MILKPTTDKEVFHRKAGRANLKDERSAPAGCGVEISPRPKGLYTTSPPLAWWMQILAPDINRLPLFPTRTGPVAAPQPYGPETMRGAIGHCRCYRVKVGFRSLHSLVSKLTSQKPSDSYREDYKDDEEACPWRRQINHAPDEKKGTSQQEGLRRETQRLASLAPHPAGASPAKPEVDDASANLAASATCRSSFHRKIEMILVRHPGRASRWNAISLTDRTPSSGC